MIIFKDLIVNNLPCLSFHNITSSYVKYTSNLDIKLQINSSTIFNYFTYFQLFFKTTNYLLLQKFHLNYHYRWKFSPISAVSDDHRFTRIGDTLLQYNTWYVRNLCIEYYWYGIAYLYTVKYYSTSTYE